MVAALRVLSLLLLASVAVSQERTWSVGFRPEATLVLADARLAGDAERVVSSDDGAVDLADDRARLTFGPHAALGVDSGTSFTLALELRTLRGGFATPLMCREGGRVHYSIVLGRETGRASFEVWSWARARAMSARRIDDGAWHRILACHDAGSGQLVLLIDGVIEAVVPVGGEFAGSPAPSLRLGNNLDPNVHQPFDGALRGVSLSRGLPEVVREALALRESARMFPVGRAEAMVRAWNDRHRPKRDPRTDAGGHAARVVRTRALVQDALGLWPPPFSGERLAGRPSPLSGAADAGPTDFATFRPTLPLDVVEGGSLERDGYRLTRLYWRTFARFFASGWLYLPSGAAPDSGRPAVLCPHGHWSDGARHPVVQARCITLASLGYVVLAVDSLHVYDDRVALSPVAAMTWANLRALELLRSRRDVDAARIGCTGASGGGQQTYYLTGLDAGLAAAVPAVMVCHLCEILDPDHVHCACNHVPHLARVLDVPQMSAAFAPRPQLFLSVTGDWTARFPSEGFPAIRELYGSLGAPDRVGSLQWDHGHDYDRPMRDAMYAFFERWLRGVEVTDVGIESADLAVEEVAVLRALERDDLARDPSSIAEEFTARLAVDSPVEPVDVAVLRQRLSTLVDLGEPASGSSPCRIEVREPFDAWTVPSDADVDLPVLRLRGDGPEGSGVTIVVAGRGKADVLARRGAVVDALRAQRREIWLADVRYTGELDVGAQFRDLHGRFYGRDEGRLAVLDLHRLVDAAAAGSGEPIQIVAFGHAGAPALLVSALDPRVRSVVVPELGPTYRAADRRPRLSRILLHGDLPEAAMASYAVHLRLGGVADAEAWRVAGASCGARLRVAESVLEGAALLKALVVP